MCEIAIRVRNKVGSTPERDAALTKRGDVIEVVPGLEEVSPDALALITGSVFADMKGPIDLRTLDEAALGELSAIHEALKQSEWPRDVRDAIYVVRNGGWNWGLRELDAPDLRIVKLPNVSTLEASQWLAPEPQTNPRQPSRVRQCRAWTLDLDELLSGAGAFLSDDTRQVPIITLTYRHGDVHALATLKPKLVDSGGIFEPGRVP